MNNRIWTSIAELAFSLAIVKNDKIKNIIDNQTISGQKVVQKLNHTLLISLRNRFHKIYSYFIEFFSHFNLLGFILLHDLVGIVIGRRSIDDNIHIFAFLAFAVLVTYLFCTIALTIFFQAFWFFTIAWFGGGFIFAGLC